LLSEEEKQLVRLMARERTNANRLWFYATALFAPVVMAIFGFAQRNYLALTVAFPGLLGLMVWLVLMDLRYAKCFRGICAKLLTTELVDGGPQ
jgi:hypothetical protein